MIDPQRILLMPMLGLGDAVSYLPFLESMRARFPKAQIVVIVAAAAAGAILEENSPGLEVIVFNRGKQRGWKELLFLLLSIRRRKFDLTISGAHLNSVRVPLFAYIAGSPIRIGADAERLSFLYNRRVKVRGDAHYFERYRTLLAGVGIEVAASDYLPRLCPPDAARVSAERIWNEAGLGGVTTVIGLASGADLNSRGRWKPSLKRWSTKGYAEIAKWTSEEAGARVVFFGSQEEHVIAEEIAATAGVPVINLCGKTTIGELQWLVSKCAVFIANDTGTMHIAAALGTNLVALFGPTKDEALLIPGEKRRIVRGSAPCSPCHGFPTCDLNGCAAMDNLSAPEVITQVRELLTLTAR